VRLILVLCLLLAACAEVPELPDNTPTAKPVILGTRGPLTDKQSKALFARLGPDGQDMLQRHLAVEQAVAETPLLAGNRTRVLENGPDTFRAMFEAIRAAQDHVNLEYFILEDVKVDDMSLGDLLVAKRHQGVQVNVIYDSYGSIDTPDLFFDRLIREGISVVQYHPFNPIDAVAGGYSPNDRDHRKILVVDGKLAIVGGVNLSAAYTSAGPGHPRKKDDPQSLPWRDTDLQIEGPAVAQLQHLFLDQWQGQQGPALDTRTFFPTLADKGREAVRIIGSSPDRNQPRFYVTLLSAIRTAQKRVWLNTAYFVPTPQEMEDLIGAAKRGADVRIEVPDSSDSDLAIAVQHSRYEDLLEAGVQIYETHDEILHSKSAVIDGVWSVIGSSNFDHRSVIFNDEVDAVVVGGDTAQSLEALFAKDFAKANRIELAAWKDRPLVEKMREMIARTSQSML
jgi:cardiolipin synthase A/B